MVDEKKCEEIGRISKPLLKIQPGKKWYALKDSTLKERARGQNPRILLELNVAWNVVSILKLSKIKKLFNYLQLRNSYYWINFFFRLKVQFAP